MRRFAFVLSADIFAKGVLAFVTIALIRFLEPGTYAAYTFAIAVATAASQTLAASFNRIYIVGHEKLALSERVESFLGLQLALVLCVAVLAAGWSDLFGGTYLAVVFLGLAMVLSDFAKTFFQQQNRFSRYSGIEVARALLQAIAVAAVLTIGGERLRASPVLAAQATALLVASLAGLGTRVRWHRAADPRTYYPLAREILVGRYGVLVAYFGAVALFSQVDVFMLRWLAPTDSLAAYGAALRYYALLSLALGAVHAVLLPAIQKATSAQELAALYRKHSQLVLAFVPAVGILAFAAQWLLPLVDRGRYPESVTVFRVLALSSIVSFAFSPHVNLLMKLERFDFLLRLILVASAVAIALHAILIPRWGALGAAIATLLASALVTVRIFFCARDARRQGLG
ncbi:MAG TPA: polysaccharide biosynthesis C-terminal domain-containing protein [Burkholderiaceae bacterium]|nr:polysaccharide biosynthesis C-terminal domain-containing protein [Burkholderiaceae bacterium]